MRKSANYKALYNFTKQRKLKDSTSTKDPEDSLDKGNSTPHARSRTPRPHLRTQSCPEPPPQPTPTKSALSRGKGRPKHQHYHSQTSIDALSQSQQSVSVQSLSVALYRKQSKEVKLRKVGGSTKGGFVNQEQFVRRQQEQQMRSYELSQELEELERSQKATDIKQQILNSLLGKMEPECESVSGP